MVESNEPKLEAPGAGLPAPMLFVAKRASSLRAKFCSSEKFLAEFTNEQERITQIIAPLSADERSKRILIPRLIGLEDSSRYHSVWMTLDHLRICNSAFAPLIKQLSEEKVPEIKINTADVKPDPKVTQKVEAKYNRANDEFLNSMEQIEGFKSEAKLEHPWFGPMNAHRWLGLSAFHMKIHRRQIEAIIKRVRA